MDRMLALPLQVSKGDSHQDTATATAMAAFYENSVPSHVSVQLEFLYQSLYSTLAQLQFGSNPSLADVHTYILYRNGLPNAVLLFRVNGPIVNVLNEVITINNADAEGFASFIFHRFKSVSAISFHAIRCKPGPMTYWRNQFNVLEDIVSPLPSSEEEYLAALGKSTRKTIKYYSNKLKREFPTFSYRIFTKDGITRDHVRTIVDMKAARMAAKNKTALVEDQDIDRILGLAKCYGVVGIATIDGKPCGGWLGYRVGKNDFMDMCAYDIAYEKYRLGTLCCYFAILDCIARGGKECHFQWGQDDYKFRFLGVRQDLYDLIIYRSPISMLLYGAKFWRSGITHLKRNIKKTIKQYSPILKRVGRDSAPESSMQ